jgi:hypothetical protein
MIPVCRKQFLLVYKISKNHWDGMMKDVKSGKVAPKKLYVYKQTRKLSHKVQACIAWLVNYGETSADRVPNAATATYTDSSGKESKDKLVLDSCYRSTIWERYVEACTNGDEKADTVVSTFCVCWRFVAFAHVNFHLFTYHSFSCSVSVHFVKPGEPMFRI